MVLLLADLLCLEVAIAFDLLKFGDDLDLAVLGVVTTVSPMACNLRTASSRAFSRDEGVPVLILLPAVVLAPTLSGGSSILEATLGWGVLVMKVTSLTLFRFVLRICSWP